MSAPRLLRAPGARFAVGAVSAAVVISAALAGLARPALAAPPNALSNGGVQPTIGTTQSTFVFTVRFESAKDNEPTAVTVVAGNVVVPLTLVSGQPSNGRYRGTAKLPEGTWDVVFQAAAQGNDPSLTGPTLMVAQAPQPTPKPTRKPTPKPTPKPTAKPTAAPTAAQPTVAPQTTRPRSPRPDSPKPHRSPRQSPRPSPSPNPSAMPRSSGIVVGGVATPTPEPSPGSSPGGTQGLSPLMTVTIGTLLAIGGLAMVGMFLLLAARRRRRKDTRLELLPEEARDLPAAEAAQLEGTRTVTAWERDWALDEAPIGSVEYRPPPVDEGG